MVPLPGQILADFTSWVCIVVVFKLKVFVQSDRHIILGGGNRSGVQGHLRWLYSQFEGTFGYLKFSHAYKANPEWYSQL